MEINFDEQLKNMVGVGLVDANQEPLTLGKLAADVLLQDYTDLTTGDEKVELYKLARLLFKGGKLEINKEFLYRIRDAIGRKCPPMVVGSAYEMMEKAWQYSRS